MSSTPLITFIVPVYNTEVYIEECISSVINQNFRNWELIAVNDGSTDGSRQILEEFAAKDHRIIPIHISNKGVSHARNLAMTKARGEWIFCLDSDDFLLDGALDKIASAIEKYVEADTIRFHFKAIGPDRVLHDTKFIPHSQYAERYLPGDIFLKNIILSRWSNPFNSVTRRSLIMEHSLFFNEQMKYMEDTVWHIDVARHCKKCVWIPECTYVYRYGRPGASNSKVSAKSVANIIGAIKCLREEKRREEKRREEKSDLSDFLNFWINELSLATLRNLPKLHAKRNLFNQAHVSLPKGLAFGKKLKEPEYFLFHRGQKKDRITNCLASIWNISPKLYFMVTHLITFIISIYKNEPES